VCHEMQPAVEGWSRGTHDDYSCLACHADPGVIGYLKVKIVDGLWRDVRIHLTNPPEQVAKSYVPPSRCMTCHADEFRKAGFLEEHPTEARDLSDPDEYCPECHRDSIHENDRPENQSSLR